MLPGPLLWVWGVPEKASLALGCSLARGVSQAQPGPRSLGRQVGVPWGRLPGVVPGERPPSADEDTAAGGGGGGG